MKIIDNVTETVNVAFSGHVDHGKSSLIGRLLAETGSLPSDKLAVLRRRCAENSRSFEYAFLADALKDEQFKGMTIDTARLFLTTKSRNYALYDTPGHSEFLKNMATGVSKVDGVFVVIDAHEGIKENSLRHGYMLHFLGIKQAVVLVNKMDLVGYDHKRFCSIVSQYAKFLGKLGMVAQEWIPVSARNGNNIARHSREMEWYRGPTVLDAMANFKKYSPVRDDYFRMPVQDVYQTNTGRRPKLVVVGKIESGDVHAGERVAIYPYRKKATITAVETLGKKTLKAGRPMTVGLFLKEKVRVERGDVIVRPDDPSPIISKQIHVTVFWFGDKPMRKLTQYIFKYETQKSKVRISVIKAVMQTNTLLTDHAARLVRTNEAAECELTLESPVTFPARPTNGNWGNFVIIDDFDICGTGIIRAPRLTNTPH